MVKRTRNARFQTRRVSPRSAVRVLACMFVAPGVVCVAQETGPTPVHRSTPAVATNQATSIVPPETVEGPVDPKTSTAGEAEAEGRSGEPSSTLRGRTRRGTVGREDSIAALGDGADVPWYRTGIGALSIVLVVIGTLVWAIRRWMPSVKAGDRGVLRVVGRTNVSPRHSLALIAVGRRFVLVGVSGDKMSRICMVSDPDEVAELTVRLGVHADKHGGAFQSQLSKEVDEFSAVRDAPTRQSDTPSPVEPASPESVGALLKLLRTRKVG